jgi:adenine-specific DNA-methyltransferase
MPTLNWIGKEAVVAHHRHVPTRLLECDAELSVGDPNAENLLVEGDNLEALKALLPRYRGKVKCIYIDPPYNTGNEGWKYNDNVNDPRIKKWLGDVVGKEAEDLCRHDKWLCMMYPRLELLREFLKDDGLIFVSVDENEHCYLALIMAEIFGSQNHLETLIWKKSYGGGAKSKHIVNLHEYIVCYARNIEKIPVLELPPNKKSLKYYKFKDSKYETRGPYRLQPLATNSMDPRPNLRYSILYEGEEIWPEKQWQWAKERVMTALADDELVIMKKKGKWTVSYKQYLKDDTGEERASKAYSIIEGIYTQQGTNELKAMFGDGKVFSFPKPRALVEQLIQLSTSKNSLVLDSFAGSGTTGHAILEINKMDGGHRRFILVEMEESVCQSVTAKRLTKAVQGYEDVPGLAGGFHFCRLGRTLLDKDGNINGDVPFADLARYVFLHETGVPVPKRPRKDCPLLGVHRGRAIYLLYNGILGDKRPAGGNVLTRAVLTSLPPHPEGDGPRVIYGEACRLSDATLDNENIIFRHVPYALREG